MSDELGFFSDLNKKDGEFGSKLRGSLTQLSFKTPYSFDIFVCFTNYYNKVLQQILHINHEKPQSKVYCLQIKSHPMRGAQLSRFKPQIDAN